MNDEKVEALMDISKTFSQHLPGSLWPGNRFLEETPERYRKGRECDRNPRLKGRALVSWIKNRMKDRGKRFRRRLWTIC